MGVKWKAYLERGVFQHCKGRGLKNFSRLIPYTLTLLAPIAGRPPALKPLRGPCCEKEAFLVISFPVMHCLKCGAKVVAFQSNVQPRKNVAVTSRVGK